MEATHTKACQSDCMTDKHCRVCYPDGYDGDDSLVDPDGNLFRWEESEES